MDYLEFKIRCREGFRDILIAELAEIGFDSFLETDFGFDAYQPEDLFDREAYAEIINKYQDPADISVEEGRMAKVNWNKEWEKNYDPIEIGREAYVRASFHKPKKGVTHEIVINPKMSFGTGHHATTFLMLKHQLDLDHKGKRVVDIGSGTGILAIMAHKLGATEIVALDIDEWCVENGKENFTLNGLPRMNMQLGTIREVAPAGKFDIALANINKNVLLDEMEVYSDLIKPRGHLLLSGFYEEDIPDLLEKANSYHFHLKSKKSKNNWAALVMEKHHA